MRYILIFTIAFILFSSCGEERSTREDNYLEQIYYDKLNNISITDSISYVFQLDSLSLNGKLKNIKSSEELTLKDLKFTDKIFLYISDIHCATCVDQEIEMIKKIYNSEDIVIICNYKSQRDLKLYMYLHKFDFPTYLMQSKLSSFMESFTSPVYFKLNSEGKPTNVFFASISAPNRSKQYHALMSNHITLSK
ncbi:MAG: hypothetical protein ACJAS3_002220 [Roseivirga sp.]|jgi:hypothetical protein